MTNSIDPGQHLWWLASRSVGVVAMLLVSLSVALGLAMSGRIVRGPGVAARLKTFHEALALSGMLAIVLHGLLLLPDPYLHPGLAGITIPFALPARRAGVAAGIDGVFMEVHQNPPAAKSDAQNALRLDRLESLLHKLVRIHDIARGVAV